MSEFEFLMPGCLVMYQADKTMAKAPHVVLERRGDMVVLKPLFMVLRERYGAFMALVSQVKPASVVRVRNKPHLDLTRRQVRFLLRAVDYYEKDGKAGGVELEVDELCALHNARGALEVFQQKRGGENE